jgi:NAD(P)-dependent dehydrogenase (short-subunit alcohol dehydrogenase family)
MSKKLEGKVAVITGGSSGIGLATARRLVVEGAHVFITGRRQVELDKAVRQIGGNVTGVQCDVSNLGGLDRLFGTVREQQGCLRRPVRQRRRPGGRPARLITEEGFAKVFNINVNGLLFTVQMAIMKLLTDCYA